MFGKWNGILAERMRPICRELQSPTLEYLRRIGKPQKKLYYRD
jgi:hypothetical protein